MPATKLNFCMSASRETRNQKTTGTYCMEPISRASGGSGLIGQPPAAWCRFPGGHLSGFSALTPTAPATLDSKGRTGRKSL